MEDNKSGLNAETFGEEAKNNWKTDEDREITKFVMPEDDGYQERAYDMPQDSYEDLASHGTYYNGTAVMEEEKQQGRALEICALVFGILSIVGCMCCGVFGIPGLILSIICFAKGKKSGLSIAGLICSILGILLSVIIVFLVVTNDEFKQGFADGLYESGTEVTEAPDDDTTEATETTEIADTSDTGDTTDVTESAIHLNQDSEYGKVILCGKEIVLPCKFGDIQDYVEIDEYSVEDFAEGIEAGDSEWYSIAVENSENYLSIGLENPTDKKLTDMSEAVVFYISESNYEEKEDVQGNYEIFGGLKLGSSLEEVEKVAKTDEDYYESHETDYDYYSFSFYPTDGEVYNCTATVSKKTGRVYSLEYVYYGY